MDASGNGQGHYSVGVSGMIAQRIKEVYSQAAGLGQGKQVLVALRIVHQRLRHDPRDFGEAKYNLKVAKLEVRTAVVAPLAVSFAVHVEKPLVFIKTVDLLSITES